MRLTDPQVAEAINLLHQSAQELAKQAAVTSALADRHAEVASALHDMLVEAQARPLRSVG